MFSTSNHKVTWNKEKGVQIIGEMKNDAWSSMKFEVRTPTVTTESNATQSATILTIKTAMSGMHP